MRRFGITFDLQDPGRPDTMYLDGPSGGTAFRLRIEYRWELAA